MSDAFSDQLEHATLRATPSREDTPRLLLDRITKMEGTVDSLTKAIGAFRIEIEGLKDRYSKHSHASHSHLGVDQALEQLRDEIQHVKEIVFGADEGCHSSFVGELLDLRSRVTIAEALGRQAILSIDELKRERLFASRSKDKV